MKLILAQLDYLQFFSEYDRKMMLFFLSMIATPI
jgi:hypothetical protein